MPGIFGVCNWTGNKNIENLANQMQSKLEHNEEWFSGKYIDHQLGFHGIVNFDSQLESDYTNLNDKSAAVYGDIYTFRDQKLSKNKAEAILSLYEKYGLDFLKHLNGSFVLSIYDNGNLIIANDRLGSKSLFYTIKSDGILYSSEIKAVLADKSIKRELNYEAIAEFFTFSYPLGNKTFFEGIELLPHASILISHRNKIQIKRYWDFKFDREKQNKDLNNLIKEFDTVMEKAVGIRMADKDKIGIFLSGGLDSRLLAGFAKRIADRAGKELISFTFGTRGGWQEKIASKVAEELEIENRFYEIPDDMIANYAEEVVYKGDGHMRIRDAHFISLLDKIRSECKDVLVGFFCDTIFGTHLHEDILQISSKEEFVGYLFNKYKVKQIAEHIPTIFSKNFLDNLGGKVKENFTNTVMETPFDSYDDIAHYWDIRQRGRRYMLPMSNYVEWYIKAMDPFLDDKVVDFAVNLPLELKFRKKIIHIACKSIFPNLSDIPLEDTGAPPHAVGLSRILPIARRLALAKAKSAVERISFGRILFKPKDYRGYEYWLRTGSKKYVEDVLLQSSTLYLTSIFDQKYVENIVYNHMKGEKNYDQLICDLINFKLTTKRFFT